MIILLLLLCIPLSTFCAIDWNRQDSHEMHQFLQQFIQPGDLVFDVGANIGKKTHLYLRCQARVVCFEPQENCVASLRTTFANNPLVTIEPVGLANKNGIMTLLQSTQTPTLSTFCQRWTHDSRFSDKYQWDQHITVPVTTLDAMIQKYGIPQLCKIDVEGFEYEVIKGLSRRIPYIIFECSIEHLDTTEQCLEHLTALGYTQFNLAIAERGIFFSSTWLDAHTLLALLRKEIGNPKWHSIWGLWGDIYAR